MHYDEYSLLADEENSVFVPELVGTKYLVKGSQGMLRRQCTQRWKIAPMRRKLQELRNKEPIEQWLGISTDEALRMKSSDVKYITHRWPLIEMEMNRADCKQWLVDHDLPIAPRSSCVFCPYHSTKEWRTRKSIPDDWERAVAVDQSIRDMRPPFPLFVHPARIPLVDVDFRTQEEKGQLRLWDEECAGICGI